jgi:hypothetical protein
MRTIVRTKQIDITDRLAALGLRYEILRDAILAGEIARDSCTANDPANAPGFDAWARTVRSAREILIPMGWKRHDVAGLPMIVSPKEEFAIVIGTGDNATGDPEGQPRTRYPKGPSTAAAVECNRRQLKLFEPNQPVEAVKNGSSTPDLVTLYLLRNRVDEMVFCELSIPAAIGPDGHVEEWAERIILERISLGPDFGNNGPQDGGEEIVVDVRRRQN